MEDLPTAFLFPTTLFSFSGPGQFAPNWFRRGSHRKGNHVEEPFAKPPPIVLGKVWQITFAKDRLTVADAH